jgi:enoyl-CoA hydratase/carnithine racemase
MPGMTDLVTREDRGGWALLTLNRPDKLNALTVPMFAELRRHVEALKHDDTISCVVLRGAGKCFSAGHDLADIAEGEEAAPPGWHSETLRMMEVLPKPVIAAVHGHCYTGALEVAMACDLIVAADNARFGDTHAKFAMAPIWGMSQRLPRRVGAATAKRLMFTADIVDAAEAMRIGLVEYTVPLDDFDREIESLAGRIAANSSFSHAENKRLMDDSDGLSLAAGLHWETAASPAVGPDMLERIARFTAKGK